MLFFVKSHVEEFKGLSSNEIQNLVQEIEAVGVAKAAGKIVAAYHASEQPQVMGIVDVESENELAQLLDRLPIASYFNWEVLPVYKL